MYTTSRNDVHEILLYLRDLCILRLSFFKDIFDTNDNDLLLTTTAPFATS